MSNPEDYTVGWVCAISTERVAAEAFLDEEHEPPEYVSPHDNNDYTLGTIGKHNVVIAVLPDGEYGIASAASVARDMLHSFPNVRIGLMVGIGGGAPSAKHDIRLGDVVVSAPCDGGGGVFQYDFGKTAEDRNFRQTGFLDQPPMVLRTAVNGIKAQYKRKGHQLKERINDILQKNPRLRQYKRPGASSDRLYKSRIIHSVDEMDCAAVCGDDPSSLISRTERTENGDNPAIHYGIIASSNQLIKDAVIRDRLAIEKDVLCFEMEAAGLMNHFPCLVIRGICDYSDSHKNKKWQGYAAIAAAAYTKDLLLRIAPNKVKAEKKTSNILLGLHEVVEEHLNIAKEQRQAQSNLAKERLYDKEEQCHQLFRLTSSSRDTTYEWYKDRVEERVEDTCLWFLKHEHFQNWLEQESGPLLVTADPGCGKSVLAKYLIEHHLPRSIIICYFFFKDQDQNTTRQALCALLHQLFNQKRSLIKHAMAQYRKDGQALIDSKTSLWKVLQDATKDPQAGPIIIILDALDECAESEFADLMRNIESQFRTDQLGCGRVKYLLTCRPYEQIVSKFRGLLDTFPYIRIPGEEESEAISQEVNRVITHRVNRLSDERKLRPEIKSHLTKRLQDTTHRTYLWVYLLFDYLEKEDFKKTQKGIDSSFALLPTSVNEAYERILNRSKQNKVVRKALSIILAASRPLTLSEMNIAMNIDNTLQSIHDLDLEDDDDFKLRLRSWCGLFISIHQGSVYLLHQTAREFLLADLASSKAILSELRWHHSITIYDAHTVLADICVRYLNFFNSDVSFPADANRGGGDTAGRYTFLPYSAKTWSAHFREAGTMNDATIVSYALKVCDPASKSYSVWFKIYWATIGTKTPENLTGLMVASHLGHIALIKHLLEEDANIEAKDEYGRTSLSWAAGDGYEAIVELFLEKGGDIETKDRHGRTPLSLAAEMGRVAVVKLLLQKSHRVDVNSRSSDLYDSGRSPLSYAAENGHQVVVDLLIAHEHVTIDSEDSRGKTPLIYAVAAANNRIANVLIDHGASVTKVDYERKGMLHHATVNAYSELHEVENLISRGAPTKSVDAENMTPLHYAVRFCRADIAELLLRVGVSVDIAIQRRTWIHSIEAERRKCKPHPVQPPLSYRMGRGLTPLHYAAWVGQDKMVSLFLQHKADPNALSEYGETPLHLALAKSLKGTEYKDYWTDNDSRVEAVLDYIDFNEEDEYEAALEMILAHRMAVINLLLNDARTDVSIKDYKSESALHKIRYGEYGSSQFVKRLLQGNVVPSSRCCDNRTPLHLACKARDFSSVSLLASPMHLTRCDSSGQNALHIASNSGCIQTMTVVVNVCKFWEVDLSSTRDKHQRNALHRYATSLCIEEKGIQLLLDYGVDSGETDVDGNLPLSLYLDEPLLGVEDNVFRLLLANRCT